MRRRVLTTKKKIETPMPVALYDSVTGEKFQTTNIGKYSSSRYTPIGVVVIPTSHDVYGEAGCCGVMALKYASLENPEEGSSTYIGMMYGPDNAPTPDFDYIATIKKDATNGIITNELDSFRFYSTLPRDDKSYFYPNPFDTKTFYNSLGDYCLSPSPYNNDGSKNVIYHQKYTDSNEFNILAYFDAKSLNTTIWNNGDMITSGPINIDDKQRYNAVNACMRYKCIDSSINWYLPCIAELGYYCVRAFAIAETFLTIKDVFAINIISGERLTYGNNIWSITTGSNNPYKFNPNPKSDTTISEHASYYKCGAIPFTHLVLPTKN